MTQDYQKVKLTKIIEIPDIDKYNISILNGLMTLTLKEDLITELPTSLTNTKIKNCRIYKKSNHDLISSDRKAFRTVLVDIWKSMPTQKIIQNTTFNIELENMEGNKGYTYHKDLKFSFQSKDTNGTWKEIVKMVELNNYQMEIVIQLTDGKIVEYYI